MFGLYVIFDGRNEWNACTLFIQIYYLAKEKKIKFVYWWRHRGTTPDDVFDAQSTTS